MITQTVSLIVTNYHKDHVDRAVKLLGNHFSFASRGFHQLNENLRVPTINVFANRFANRQSVIQSIRDALTASELD